MKTLNFLFTVTLILFVSLLFVGKSHPKQPKEPPFTLKQAHDYSNFPIGDNLILIQISGAYEKFLDNLLCSLFKINRNILDHVVLWTSDFEFKNNYGNLYNLKIYYQEFKVSNGQPGSRDYYKLMSSRIPLFVYLIEKRVKVSSY
jgi:hypothetical protein